MRNTPDVTVSKPITLRSQSIGVSVINPLVAFYDIPGTNRDVLFFYSIPDTTRDIIDTRYLLLLLTIIKLNNR
jgi:hypothetical protein